MDENKLYKISKKYNSKQLLKYWEVPEEDVSIRIHKLLARNNKTNNKHVNSAIRKITRVHKLPKNLDINDFNESLQLDKSIFLKNLYSNQLNIIQSLTKSIKSENTEYRELKKKVESLKREITQLQEEIDDENTDTSSIAKPVPSTLEDNEIYLNHRVTVGVFDGSEVPETENLPIDRLVDYTKDISAVSAKLDHLNDLIQR